MFLKKFDRISPLITLSFKGDNMHSSIISGILTIIAYGITTVFGVIYALDFIQKKKPSAYFYTRYIEDAGQFTLNSSSLFHYFYFLNKTDSKIIPYDIDKLRIIGVENINIDEYYTSLNLEVTNHWVYGFCKNNIDSAGVGHLIENEEEFENSACIRKYYDAKVKKYYDTSDKKNFVWPTMEHGMSHPTYSFYGIIIEKCKDDNLRGLLGLSSCKNNAEIESYAFSNAIVLQIIDHYTDVLNYDEPFTKYFYSISNLLFPKSYTINNMNFNPSIIKTHTGIILDNVVEEKSFLFSQNEKVTMDEEIELKDEEGKPLYKNNEKLYKSTGIVSSYYFWLQNRIQIYERNYKKLQDILSNIGGISRTFFLIANIINSLFCGYFALSDTEEFLFSLDNNINFYNEKIKGLKKEVKDKKSEKKIVFSKNLNGDNKANLLKLSENNRNMKNDETNNKIMFSSLDNVNKDKEIADTDTRNIVILKRKKDKKDKEKISDENDMEKNSNNSNNKMEGFNWIDFICFKIRKNNPVIAYYKEYRAKVISEENFIRSQLDIYKLEKICKEE